MERSIRLMRNTVLFIAFCAGMLPAAGLADYDSRSVVLVTGKDCPLETVSTLDIRKAYLGIRVTLDGSSVDAHRLLGDEQLNRIFYQYIVAMSQKSYDRRLLSMMLKFGTPAPEGYASAEQLAQAIRQQQCDIGYLWKRDVSRYSNLKTVKVLWQGE